MSSESVGSRYLARTFCVSWPNYRVRRGRQETRGCTVNCKSNNDMPATYNVPNILAAILILARLSRRPVVLLIYAVIDDDATTRTDQGTSCLEIESSSARSKWNNIFLCLLAATRISRFQPVTSLLFHLFPTTFILLSKKLLLPMSRRMTFIRYVLWLSRHKLEYRFQNTRNNKIGLNYPSWWYRFNENEHCKYFIAILI